MQRTACLLRACNIMWRPTKHIAVTFKHIGVSKLSFMLKRGSHAGRKLPVHALLRPIIASATDSVEQAAGGLEQNTEGGSDAPSTSFLDLGVDDRLIVSGTEWHAFWGCKTHIRNPHM